MTTQTVTPSELSTTAAEPDDAELAGAEALAERDAAGEHVVAFGCRVADRVFIGAGPGQRNQSYTLTIPKCPGCGNRHEVKALPRPRRPHDEIALTIEPPPITKRAPGDSTRAAPKSDAEIIAAIPAEWTPGSVIAETLDYGNYKAFRNRIREIRQRAAAKGAPHPFEVDSSTNGLKLRAAP